jgi:hypothetical protein
MRFFIHELNCTRFNGHSKESRYFDIHSTNLDKKMTPTVRMSDERIIQGGPSYSIFAI